MELKVIEESCLHEWENESKNFNVNPFLDISWLEAFRNQNHKPICFFFISDNKIVGLAGGLQIQSKHYLLRAISKSLYFFSGPAVLNNDKDLSLSCFKCLKTYAVQNGYISLSIGSYDYPYELNVEKCGLNKKIREEYIIDMRPNLENIRKRLKKGRKWEIKKAEKLGLRFSEATGSEAVKSLVTCLDSTKNRKTAKGFGTYSYYHMNYLSKKVIKKLLQGNNAHIYKVLKGDEIISSCLLVESRNRAYYLLAGSTTIGYELSGPSFLVWKLIEKLKNNGCQYFDLGGLPTDASASNLAQFKRSFGAEKRLCPGGSVSYLQGPLRNLLAKIYFKIV